MRAQVASYISMTSLLKHSDALTNETQMYEPPEATRHHHYNFFYLSKPIYFALFNVRHPVISNTNYLGC